jgi:primosomal protein N' (replication factor Y) (superfamily II helicase)
MFVNVALNIPADKLFTYEVPSCLSDQIEIGKRVFVPFGRKKRTGVIVETINSCPLDNVKAIVEIMDEEPLFGEEDLRFYRWIASYCMYPLGKTLAEILPTGAEKKDFLLISPLPATEKYPLMPAQGKILELVRQYPQGITLSNICKISGRKNVSSTLQSLQLAGLLQIEEKKKKQLAPRRETIVTLNNGSTATAKLTPKQDKLITFIHARGPIALNDLIKEAGTSRVIIKKLQNKGIIEFSEKEKPRPVGVDFTVEQGRVRIILNSRQEEALGEIYNRLKKKKFSPILLHGITGSGKTEVYLNAIARVLENDGGAIYLVPEIALTPQLISRVAGRFAGEQIAVLHSGISESVRYDQWRQIKHGTKRLVIGARSALFAPLPDLQLIVVDEEHDSSYKQDERLCYHARDLAVLRAKLAQAVVILGSATPSIRTYYNARIKKYHYLGLPHRVEDKPLPEIEIIDMKAELENHGKAPILSGALITAIEKTLIRKEQILLFLNRRGFDTFLVCADCGYNFRCPNCAVSLKSHAAEGVIKCHYCNYIQKALPICPSCRGSRILSYGVGTQKLEAEINKLFPEARILRMDSDITATKGIQEKILHKLSRREIDILVGTQMITKGHDFPYITLVGVIAADTSLNIPDFRAGEKTFQQLIQVAGRGGRGACPGRVLIQTFNPQHYVLKHVLNHDYKSFYEEEIVWRRALNYPPFGRIINFRLSATKKETLLEQAGRLGKMAKELSTRYGDVVEIIGPAESPLAKIKGRYRWQMLIKGTNAGTVHQLASEILHKMEKNTVKITLDVDPGNFM